MEQGVGDGVRDVDRGGVGQSPIMYLGAAVEK